MLGKKELMDKICERAELFNYYMDTRQYQEAKSLYDKTRTWLVKMKADESVMTETFGDRGDRGVILKEGLFREALVQKAYYETAVKRNGGCGNGKCKPAQKNSA